MKNDCTLVGTPEILAASPNVKAAPSSVNRPIPVPSVYKDERGEIHNFALGTKNPKRINLLSTRKGVMRSGDIHENTQHDFIFEGQVEVWRLTTKGTTKKIYYAYDYLQIDPYVPHIFHFLEDTILAEWWEPPGFYAWFYEPYRKLVQNSFQPTQPGRFLILKAVTNTSDDDNGGGSPTQSTATTTSYRMVMVGLAIGLTIGCCLGMVIMAMIIQHRVAGLIPHDECSWWAWR